jgi:hypothetical protein
MPYPNCYKQQLLQKKKFKLATQQRPTCTQNVHGSNLVQPADYREVYAVFLSPSIQVQGSYLKMGGESFLPEPFQFIITLFDAIQSALQAASLHNLQLDKLQ